MFWGHPQGVYAQFRRFQTKFSVVPNYYKNFFKWHSENFKDYQFNNYALGLQKLGIRNLTD